MCVIIHVNTKKIRFFLKFKVNDSVATCVDQPFFNYHTITRGLQEMTLLGGLSTNNPGSYRDHPHLVICHFAGKFASSDQKYETIKSFLVMFGKFGLI